METRARGNSLDSSELAQLLDSKLGPLKTAIKYLTQQVATLVTKEEIKTIVYESTKQLASENKQLKDIIIYLESQTRRNNLRFLGIPEKTGETWAICEHSVLQIISDLGLVSSAIQIERAHRLGPSSTDGKSAPCPIIARFLSFKDKEAVLQKYWQKEPKKNLPEGTKILEDFPAEIDARRNKLLPYFHSARHLKVRTKLALDKLTINNETFTVDTIENIPKKYHPQHTKEIGETGIAFYRQESLFSNFHTAKFSHKGIVFTSIEQYFQYQQVKLFNNEDLAAQILRTQDPAKVKSMARSIKDIDKKLLYQNQMDIMKEGLLCKFQQNRSLKSALASTKNKQLIEASPTDKFWGAGLPLHHPKLADPTQWPGKNKLGALLVEVRCEICG